jgi:outer membrane receptor protein involved in Fe transport
VRAGATAHREAVSLVVLTNPAPAMTSALRCLLAPTLLAAAAFAPAPLLAQAAPARAADDSAALAKYDRNRDGRLDAAELAAKAADDARAATAPAARAAGAGEVVELSPFQVSAEADQGYFAANTLSGTRIKTKLEDLGASITVVTKQQMQDFAMLDLNDVFLYEANTEGTGNYTDVFIDRNGVAQDNVARDPNNANRVRGIGPANQAFGNFQTGVPIDPAMIDGLEISRGPNSNIWGLGSGSGTVNAIPSAANLTRESSRLELRTDSLGGFRTVLDLNRPLLRNKLAVRAMAIYQADEYQRQPAFSRTNRYGGMVTYKPFKGTTLRAAVESYENYARRPNAILPRDGLSYWQQSGRPTWDASTWTLTRQGVRTVVPYSTTPATENALLGPGVASAGTELARAIIFVDRGAVDYWTTGYISGINANGIASPDFHPATGHQRFIETAPLPRVGPLAPTSVSLTDRAIYDWSAVNLSAANWSQDKTDSYQAQLEHFFLSTPRHLLAVQLGFRREESRRQSRSFIGTSGESPMLVYMDVTERLPDGRANPYFLRPYVDALEPSSSRSSPLRDEYKSQLVYKLDLAREKSWLRWLGDHAASGYHEYKRALNLSYPFRDVIVSNHAWLPAGAARANGATIARANYRYYLGDNRGENIDHGSPAWDKLNGTRNFTWFNAQLGRWVDEPTTIGEAFVPGNRVSANIIKTAGGVLQSHLLGGRIVTTLGRRKDSNFNRNAAPTTLLPDGITPNYDADDVWPNNWFRRDGRTKTTGVVVRPFRGWAAIERPAAGGAGFGRFAAEFARSLNFHYNQADSFIPQTIAQNLNLRLLPNPSSQTKDYGVSLSLFGRLHLKLNLYETGQIDSRTGDAGVIATRTGRIDFAFAGNNDQFNLQRQAAAWVGTLNPAFTQDQLNAEVARIMEVPADRLAQMNAFPIAETSDVVSKGKEIEATWNPSPFWTAKATVTQQSVVEQNVTPGIQDYIDARLATWRKVIDPRTNTPWFTTRYGSAGTPSDFLDGSVLAPYKLLRATEGKRRPQQREWRANVLTNYRLAGLGLDSKWLRRLSVSAAARWESEGGIGYFAYANDPNAYDPDRIVFDKAHLYVDLGANYSTRLFRDRVGLSVQLNLRNAGENGRIQPVGALPNGQPHSFRIIDPQLFILSATFSL